MVGVEWDISKTFEYVQIGELAWGDKPKKKRKERSAVDVLVIKTTHICENCEEAIEIMQSVGELTFFKNGKLPQYAVDFKLDGLLYRETNANACRAVEDLLYATELHIMKSLIEERDQLRRDLCSPERVTEKLFGGSETVTTADMEKKTEND